MNSIDRVKAALEALKQGEFVVLMDDESRENEGDLVLAAEKMTPAKMNFMISEARGLVCVPLHTEDLERLKLPQMVGENEDARQTRFTVSVDTRVASTGISASERSETVRCLVDPKYDASHFVRPGHIFPIAVDKSGIEARRGHTEASFTLVKMAGLLPGAVICEIMNADGSMARERDLADFSKKHKLVFLTIADILEYLAEQK